MDFIKQAFFGDKAQEVTTGALLEDNTETGMDTVHRSMAVIEFECDGTILEANDLFLQTTGYSHEEIQGQHHRIFCDEQYADSAEYQEFWASLARGETHSSQFKRYKKDGSDLWLQASYCPVFGPNGKPFRVVKYAMDITEMKRESDKATQMMNMIENMPIAVLFVDTDLIIRYLNPASKQVLKKVEYALPISADQMVGTCIDAFHKNPEHQRRLLADPSNLPITTQIQVGNEKMQFDVSAILDEEGTYIGAMASGRIVTEEMRTKQEAETVGQAVASSTKELAASIEEISQNVNRTATLAKDVENHAKESAESTSGLQESSNAIGQVLGLIQDLADQTNLLALNATIEAARAGENGRSFAVVASEVKNLASKTSEATQSIESSVGDIQSRIEDVTESIKSISQSVTEVSTNTVSVASAIEEQSVTTSALGDTASKLLTFTETT